MDIPAGRKLILRELTESLANVDAEKSAEFLDLLLKSRRVFVAAEGRSKMMLQAFAKRLQHLGKESYVVGETVTPAAGPGDLLVAASGSGTTGGVLNIVKLARKYRTTVVFITAGPDRQITADLTIILPARTDSRQLMASLFEQTLLIFGDSVCLALGRRLKITAARMRKNHANLE